jgi:hypothetical protein
MTAPTEQPQPTRTGGPIIHDLVIDDLRTRLAVGIQRYGTGLQAHNGRDALRDAYEEALDLAVYLRQAIAERDTPRYTSGPTTRSPLILALDCPMAPSLGSAVCRQSWRTGTPGPGQAVLVHRCARADPVHTTHSCPCDDMLIKGQEG